MININKSIPINFENQVSKTPEAIAIKTMSDTISFAALNKKANQVARMLLKAKGTSETGQISLLFGHEIDMVVGILAVLKSGQTYIPLDAVYPIARLKFMFENSESALILSNQNNKDLALEISGSSKSLVLIEDAANEEESNINLPIPSDTLAYILYTSGSTGNPKGVCQTHRNVLHHMGMWIESLKITAQDKLSLQSAYSWDSAAQDIFGAVLSGACLYPVKINEDRTQKILDWYIAEQITVWHSTLPLYRGISREIVANRINWDAIRIIALGGDAIHLTDVKLFQQNFHKNAVLINAYGATESSSALMNHIKNDEPFDENVVPLGRPARDTDVYLESESGERMTKENEEGEIIIKSEFIAPKYWRIAPSEYKHKFSRDPDNNALIKYKTGDIGRIMSDGKIALMGRNDFQVKIGGIRVNISEVEAILKQYPLVQDAIVKAFDDDYGLRFLTAYIVLEQEDGFSVSSILKYLTEKTPDFMIPSKFVVLKKMPLTTNNKIDRKSLPYPDKSRPVLDNPFTAANTKLEKQISEIWKEVLALDDIGIHDAFFELGGNSLRLVNVNTQLNKIIEQPINMVDMYRLPTISQLAKFISNQDKTSGIKVNVQKGESRANKRLKLKRRK